MSTRYSAHEFSPFDERSTGGNREFQPGLAEQVARRNRPKRKVLARDDTEACSSFCDAEAGVRRPVNDRTAVELSDGLHSANRLKSDLSARDLMSDCVATLRPEDSIERAARLMSESDSETIPVVDGFGRLLGILTDRDITVKLIARGSSIPHAQVSDCMTSEAFACSADSSLENCMRAMSWHQVRRIPLVDDEHRVVGTISQGDLAHYACEHPERVERGAIANILLALVY